MTKDVILTITGLHQLTESDSESSEPIEMITAGTYTFCEGVHIVCFQEVFEGIEGTISSKLCISKGKIELARVGEANADMTFEKKKEYKTIYDTPFGHIELGIEATNISLKEQEDVVDADINYLMKMNGEVTGSSSLHINICSKNRKDFTK